MEPITSGKNSGPNKRISVLVVEDEEDLRNTYQDILFQKGFNVITAQDGSEAFFKYQNQDFDIVVTDLAMPKASGLDLVRSIRQSFDRGFDKSDKKNPSHLVPVLVVSGNIIDYKAEILMYENITLVEKPLSGMDLFEKINTTLSSTKSKAEQMTVDNLLTVINEKIASISQDVMSIIFKKTSTTEQTELNENNFSIANSVYYSGKINIGKLNGFLIFNYKHDMAFKICNILKTEEYPGADSFSLDNKSLNTLYLLSRGFAEKIVQSLKAKKVPTAISNSTTGGNMFSGSHLYFHGNFTGSHTKIKTDDDELEIYCILYKPSS